MKKISQRLLAAAVVAAVGVTASAEVLSPEQALGRALPSARRAAPGVTQQPVLAYTAEADELPAVYVFAKENKGFMVVSADDLATPLLGFVDNGNFDADNMAPALKYWLGEYARQIAYARANGVDEAAPRIARTLGRAEIAPKVSTLWDQGAPYNQLCPPGCPTGCVATAAAQVMKYHEYPENPVTANLSYNASVNGESVNLELDLKDFKFDWDNMLNTYTASATAEQKLAVAQLMQAAGYGAEMSYASSASGAQTFRVGYFLAEKFGYDKSVQYLTRDCYTLDEWESIIYDQLVNVGPVLYDGTTINNEGHAFVMDGYKEENGEAYFHLNWGWGGMSDGYFTVGALDPSAMGAGGAASGLGFNYDQNATINLKPADGGEYVPVVAAQGQGLSITPGSFNLGREVTVAYTGGGFYSYSLYEIPSIKFGLHIVGEGQDFYRWNDTPSEKLGTLYGKTSYTVLLSGVKENSTYVLTPAYKVGDKMYEMHMPYGAVRQYVLKTSVYNGELIPVGANLDVEAEMGNLEFKVNTRVQFNGKFVNNTDAYYFGHVAPAILQKVYGEYELVHARPNFTLNVNPGETVEWGESMRVTNAFGLTSGNYYYFGFINPETGAVLSNLVKFFFGVPSTGIDDVEIDTEAPAEYYNLQGIRVAEPKAGEIYIVRRGDKATKEYVK